MNNFVIYSIEIAISLALFYTAYWVFLKNETFFKLNRFYMILSVIVSIFMPFANISIGADSMIARNLISPIEQYEQSIGFHMDPPFGRPRKGMHFMENNEYAAGTTASLEDKTTEANSIVSSSGNSTGSSEEGTTINWLTILFAVYLVGVALFSLRFLANFVWIFAYIFKYKAQRISGMKVIQLEKSISPFSFLNYIFISKSPYAETELSKIISHEKVHIEQKHTFDLILFELLMIFQWYNPFVWFYKRSARINHEYLADLGTLRSGIDLPAYQYSLLNQILQEKNFEIASSYNFSVKKRIAMMMKKRSSNLSAFKLIIPLPILFVLFSAFAFNCKSDKKNNIQSEKSSSAVQDSTIKKVAVSVEYLNLLEGEYISTNDPNGVRKIVFTELLGELLAWDNGYSYRPIFVGNGKFINPDDKATLVFNTTNKDEISLLLFDKINLKKVITSKGSAKVQNRSLAYSTSKVMLKDGIAKGLSFYSKAKDSSNYYFTEDELNYAGYQLLEKKKLNEAAEIFKLNIERSPNSFNVYDSYAEALLALGNKDQAIEQFKKSLQLNPGSRNGLMRLKELGIDPSTVVKLPPVNMEELKLLEGVYLSTNQNNFMRKITFAVQEGELTGEDNGYKYKLISLGEGKFINPDDGASLVFDTKDKNAISLLLFGKINLQKVKTTKEPTLSLKQYAGTYIPHPKDKMLLPMEILSSENKLFRFIENPNDYTANRNIELDFVTGNIFFYPDRSARSIEFIVDEKSEVTGCFLRRPDGTFKLTKKK